MTNHAVFSFKFALFFISFLPKDSCLAQTPSCVPLGTNATEKKLDRSILQECIVQNFVFLA